jgi:hypothetical protein
MSAAAPYQIAIPDAGVAAGFTNDERALAVSSPQGSTPAGVYYLSRLINLAGGTYTLKINGSSACSVWIGEELASTSRITSYGGVQTPAVQAEFFVRPGTSRIDIVLSTLGGSCYVAFSIWKAGKPVYTSAAASWLWDTTFIPDTGLTAQADPKLSLPVFAFTPNWKSGVTERLSWLSDVFASESDTEQRRSLLLHPRRSFEAQFMRTGLHRMRLNDFIVGVGTGKFIAPFWPEQTRIPTALSAGTTTIEFPRNHLLGREFAVGEMVLIYDRDPGQYDLAVVEGIASTTVDTITLASETLRAWPAGSRVAPAYVVTFDGLPGIAGVTDRVATSGMRFEQAETFKHISPSWGYCAPLWQFRLNTKEDLQTSHERKTYEIDNGTSPVDFYDYAEVTRATAKGSLILYGRENLNAYRAFIAMARGKVARFWWPSRSHDIEPAGSVGGTTLDVLDTGYADWMATPQDARKMIGFYFNDGSPAVYRQIQSVEKLIGGNNRLTFATALPPMLRAQIERVSYVMPVRFDQDTFELHHVTDAAKAVRASVVVRSSEIEGMPPIECSITSWTYPVVAEETINVTATLIGGSLQEFAPPMEMLDVTGTIVSGTLQSAMVGYTSPAEQLDVSASVDSGTLQMVMRSVTIDPELLDVTGNISGGSLAVALISTTMDTDSVDVSATITGGTLQ